MTIKKDYPILEFDCTRDAVIEPHKLFGCLDIPGRCVITFFKDVIDRLKEASKLKIVKELRSEAGMLPVYEMEYGGERLIVYHSMIGAPAAAAIFEEVIALGCRKFIACGGAEVIRKDIAVGHLIEVSELRWFPFNEIPENLSPPVSGIICEFIRQRLSKASET